MGWDVCQSKSLGVALNPTSSAGEDGWLTYETQEVGYLINHPRELPDYKNRVIAKINKYKHLININKSIIISVDCCDLR